MRYRKTTSPVKLAITVVFLAAFGFGWQMGKSLAQRNDVAEHDPALKEARKVSADLTDKVRGLLMKELEKGGYEGAVDVCANVAQNITREFNQQTGHQVRRVSLGYRNLNDQPDDYERRLLENFDRQNRQKKLEGEHYEIVSENGRQYLRYLKPVVAGKMCLNCHGQLDEVPPRVRAILQRHYPEDKATGYHEGDVRGAISVKIDLTAKAEKR